MKALVLGGTGFIGSHVVRALVKEDLDVRVLSRSRETPITLKKLNVEQVLGDLDDLPSLTQALKGCQALFHVAGYYPLYSLQAEKQKALALKQMQNVLKAAAETSTLEKIVYTSSMSTIGKPESGLAREETPYHPKKMTGLYYEIKYLMEQEALRAAQKGLPLTVVNPTAVFGDYDVKPTSGIFILHIAKARSPIFFDAKINAVDVIDVARGQVEAMKRGRVGERYILGGHNTSIGELAELIARLAQVKAPNLKLPLLVARGLAVCSELVSRYLLHQDRPLIPRLGIDFLRHGQHYGTTKAKIELGFTTRPLEETFSRALEWFRKNGYL